MDSCVPLADSVAFSHTYNNHLTTVTRLLQQQPERAKLFPFIADPPTATMQRLKALTTGLWLSILDFD